MLQSVGRAVSICAAGVLLAFGITTSVVASADSLGQPNFNGYCNYKHQTNLLYAAGPASLTDANSWKCTLPPGIPTDDIDVNAACQWQYGGNAVAYTDNPSWPHSWQCGTGSSVAAAGSVSGPTNWSGLWISRGVQMPAKLALTSTDPIQGSIDVGLCSANWNEVQRTSDTSRIVQASVTSGPCIDNQWSVLIDPRSITGQDVNAASTNFAFTPS